ncbi:type VI secretion system tube protein Hcp [Exilibacterium tricleocarpae]|uniref:Type VI secretion system tube protein Hcp n=1 Tax=Exilibacterium tricleocarpae TaxID=2591008 RepID=A0A545SPL6_9GAMM|nr:type VI secretion system tube protein Hcp [Exilibacterium tricleocarpae]TQV66930.1 type VI secretion system tube protein Hcp [Exilibacterium tricleocarpae]
MAIYVKYDGGKLKGNVTAEGYADCFEVDSFQFGCGRGITMEVGNTTNREATRPSISEITLSKQMDASSGSLLKEALGGVVGLPVEVHLVKTGGKKIEKYAQFNLTNCLISSYSVQASAGGAPYESLSLSFTDIVADLSNADPTNKNKGSMKVGYNLDKGTPH